jgi:SAM-dependent methyltransferase
MVKTISKYKLYELSVQSPNWQVDYLPQFHRWLTGRTPHLMREDFCGSGKISCEWVKRSKKNRAYGLDIDPEVLNYAKQVNQAELSKDEQSRVQFLKQTVLKPTKEKFDFIGAFNFSYFIFHERTEMLKYFRAAFQSLKSKGTLFLEVGGGSGFKEAHRESKKILIPNLGKVEQIWEQHQYDPITQVNDFSIHFKLPGNQWLNDAFTYHWRIWEIRELREILSDAGFKRTVVLWEQPDTNGEGSGEYLPSENAENPHSFVAYVVGVK